MKERHGMRHTPEYEVWKAMRARCESQHNKDFRHYGGRGISVCERWGLFSAFISDMGRRPSQNHQIERLDNDGNYDPSNCVWATKADQANNNRRNVFLEFGGISLSLTEWSRRVGLIRSTLQHRINSGWSVGKALTHPVGGR